MPKFVFCFEYIQLPRGLKMISNSFTLLNYPFKACYYSIKRQIKGDATFSSIQSFTECAPMKGIWNETRYDTKYNSAV